MKDQIQFFYKAYPNGTISTTVHIQDGFAVFSVMLMNDGKQLTSAARVYCLSGGRESFSGMEAVKDALSLLQPITDSLPSPLAETSIEEQADVPSDSHVTAPDGSDAESSTPTASKAEAPSDSQEATPDGSSAESSTLAATQAEAPSGIFEIAPDVPAQTKRGRKKKTISAKDIQTARDTVLEFANEEKIPVSLRAFNGVTLGEVESRHPHFIRYLTQPAGKAYVPESVSKAAEVLAKNKEG